MTKQEANNLPTDMTVLVILKNQKTKLRVCPILKETIVKWHSDWSIVNGICFWTKYNDGESSPKKTGEYLCACRVGKQRKLSYQIWEYNKKGDFWETEAGEMLEDTPTELVFYAPIPPLPNSN